MLAAEEHQLQVAGHGYGKVLPVILHLEGILNAGIHPVHTQQGQEGHEAGVVGETQAQLHAVRPVGLGLVHKVLVQGLHGLHADVFRIRRAAQELVVPVVVHAPERIAFFCRKQAVQMLRNGEVHVVQRAHHGVHVKDKAVRALYQVLHMGKPAAHDGLGVHQSVAKALVLGKRIPATLGF